jgi:hypothetical protein
MSDNLYLPQVDYTSRDYSSILEDLKGLIPNFAPQWTSRDSSDFGIVLLELFAYMGDILNYQIDRAANEAFITTSTQRDTVLNIARLLNYIPNDISPATGSVTFSNYSISPVVIAKGTTLTTDSDGNEPSVSFTLNSEVSLDGANGTTPSTATGFVTQGRVQESETVGSSEGTPNQTFVLSNTGVITGSPITVIVGGLTYTKVPFIIDYADDDPVFSTFTDGAGFTYIKFGDGVSGRIPPKDSIIYVTYRYSETPGNRGNIAPDTLKNIDVANVEVKNPLGFSGGTDPESTDSVRINAPAALRSLNRAVSLKDYGQLAIQVNGVSKANAISSGYANVLLYIAAAGGYGSTELFKTTVKEYFVDKVPPGTTLTVADFTALYPYLKVLVNVKPQYNSATVGTAVTAALHSLLAFDNVTFNDVITQGDVYATCNSVEGVAYTTIDIMETLPAVYTKKVTTTSTVATNATTVNVVSSAGAWVGAKIASITGAGVVPAGTYVTAVTSSTAITISASPTTLIASGAILNFEGTNGNVPADINCALNEVPILEKSYINVVTTGGTV